MKKLLLCGLFGFFAMNMNAQTQVFFDDFEDEDISDWMLYDEDGDDNWWGDLFTITNSGGTAVTPVSMISRSWQGTPLFPDNWAVTPMIDLSVYPSGSTVTLTWKVKAAAASWDQEQYSVYASTANDVATLLGATVTFNETYDDIGNTGPILDRSLDMSSLAGQAVYVAFRHHDCSDMDYLCIDDVTVTASVAKTDNFFASNFSVSPNPASDVITIGTKNNITVNAVQLIDMNGRVVKEINTSFDNQATMNIAEINSGVYFVKVNATNGVGTSKIIKK